MDKTNFNFTFIDIKEKKKELTEILNDNQVQFVYNLEYRVRKLEEKAILLENFCKDIEDVLIRLSNQGSDLIILLDVELGNLELKIKENADRPLIKMFAIESFKTRIIKIEEENPLSIFYKTYGFHNPFADVKEKSEMLNPNIVDLRSKILELDFRNRKAGNLFLKWLRAEEEILFRIRYEITLCKGLTTYYYARGFFKSENKGLVNDDYDEVDAERDRMEQRQFCDYLKKEHEKEQAEELYMLRLQEAIENVKKEQEENRMLKDNMRKFYLTLRRKYRQLRKRNNGRSKS